MLSSTSDGYKDIAQKELKKFVHSPYCFALSLFAMTYANAIMFSDVFSTGHVAIVVGYMLRWLALFLAYLLLFHLFAVKYESSAYSPSLLQNNFHIPPQTFLSWLTVIGVIGGSLSYGAKAVISCNDYEYEGVDPCCCNEVIDTGHLPPGFYVQIAILFFMQVMVSVTWWVITPCWVAIAFSSIIPRIVTPISAFDDDVVCLCIMAMTSIMLASQTESNLEKTIQLVKSENEAVSLQSNAMMLETRMNDMRLLVGNISHDLKTPMHAFHMELCGLQDSLLALRATQLSKQNAAYNDFSQSNHLDSVCASVLTLKDTCSFMNATINRCLDYSSATVGMALCPLQESVHLHEAMSWVMNCVNRTQEGKVQVVMEDVPPSICSHINTDKKWLEENLLCLVSNAVKFQMEGVVTMRCKLVEDDFMDPAHPAAADLSLRSGSHRSVSLRAVSYRSGGKGYSSESLSCREEVPSAALYLRFEVDDTGIGIDEEKKKSLFHAYSDDRNVAGGTGLGLYSLSKRVEALGGVCGVESKVGGEKGSLFWFAIPYMADKAEKSRTIDVQKSHDAAANLSKKSKSPLYPNCVKSSRVHVSGDVIGAEQEGMKVVELEPPSPPTSADVLLVEDSIIIQKTTKRTFESAGYRVDVASNGLIGLNQLMKRKYDLVLMDLQMPVMDGAEATRRLRKHEEDQGMHAEDRQVIVGISANCDNSTQLMALESGMDAFVPKPFSIDDLERMLVELNVRESC